MEIKRTRRFKGENRSQLIERLKNKKKAHAEIKKAKEEINNKTGKEYFFKYNSMSNKELIKRETDKINELEKKKIYLEKEICRVEKKLKAYPRIKAKRIVFDEDGNIQKEDKKENEDRNEEREEYEKYLKELFETKTKVENKLGG